MRQRLSWLLTLLVVLGALPVLSTATAFAEPIQGEPFSRTWARTDQPLAQGQVSRTWMWGPEPFTGALQEEYAESPGALRTVQYFDKSRMEITNPGGDQSSQWYVTNGLLVMELVTGRMQTGNDSFVERAPAQVNVAGDADDAGGPTYATFGLLRSAQPAADGATITSRVNRQGTVSTDDSLAAHGVTAAWRVTAPGLDHQIASPFWAFMNSSGPISEGGVTHTARLFEDPFYATGLPITEAYWATVKVGGTARDVLMQCFERRCLTFTPGNDAAWQVEAGNVGQHYYAWRYGGEGPSKQANELARQVRASNTDDERYAALLDVMSALHVGVYGGDGTQIIGGAERGAADFYVYDIELRMMAGALGRGQTWGVVDLAMTLTTMELLPEGQTFDPSMLRQAIVDGMNAARQAPGEHGSLGPLLTRQLGLTHAEGADLFTSVSLENMRFDALQYFIILSDISLTLAGGRAAHLGDSDLIAQSNGVLKPMDAAPGDCQIMPFNGDGFKNGWGWTKIGLEVFQKVPQAIGKYTAVLDGIHGSILAFSVGVTSLDERVETHYGHDGAGTPMHFRMKVEMRDALPETLVQCGWVAGTDFPAKGPIKDVSVHWFWPELAKHGTVNCGSACPAIGENGLSIDATNAEGIATMTFFPKQEEVPGAGWVVEEQGTVTGIALYQSRFTNLLGAYAQYLTPKSGATRWTVKWHEAPGWNVTMTLDYNVLANWKVQIQDEGYFEEIIGANGEIVVQFTIPADAVNGGDGSGYQTPNGTGNGHYIYIANDHTIYQAYDHWVHDCNTPWSGEWPATTMYGPFEVIGGETWLTLNPAMGPWPTLYRSDDPACLGDTVTSDLMRMIQPKISLSTTAEQTRDLNPSAMCEATRKSSHFQMDIGTTDSHPRSLTSCSGNARWTIVVEWNSPPAGS